MKYDIKAIIQRMKDVSGSKKNADLARYLGTRQSTFAGWVENNRVPYDQCFQIYEKTGVTVEYLITGKSPTNDPTELIDKKNFCDLFEDIYRRMWAGGYTQPTEKTTAQNLRVQAEQFYAEMTNPVTIPSVNEKKEGKAI